MRRFSFGRLLIVLGVLAMLGIMSAVAAGASDGKASARAHPSATGPCDGTIAIGEIVSCNVAVGGTKDLTFPGAVNDRIRVRVVKTSGTILPKTQVRRPNGTAVCADTTAQSFTCVLDTNGTHTVRVADFTGTGSGTVNITVQRLNDPVGCVKGKLGKGKNGAINDAAEID